MQCWYQVENGDWFEGTIMSSPDSTAVYFVSRKDGKILHEMRLKNVTIVFGNSFLNVMGYDRVGRGENYRLVSVDVVFTKPK